MRRLFQDTNAASAAEYALILAIVGAAIALAAISLGTSISNSFSRSTTEIETCGGGC
ncbi:MAG TPA: Flp family type IVb pilin [Sphingomicrobium sp.]|nr:Flp family type IVb pilin [Sphingomicrobium sp.]